LDPVIAKQMLASVAIVGSSVGEDDTVSFRFDSSVSLPKITVGISCLVNGTARSVAIPAIKRAQITTKSRLRHSQNFQCFFFFHK
jgi:hypothetical protein